MTAGATRVAPPAAGSPSRRRQRLRTAVVVVTALLGIAGLLWAADRLARDAAESLIAGEVQRATGVFTLPEVEVHGGSFLLQAVRGRYDRVDIAVTGLSSGALTLDRVDARLEGVRLAFPDLLLRDPAALVIERSQERAVLGYDDLTSYLAFTGRPYEVAPAGDPEQARLTGTVAVFGEEYDVEVDAELGAEFGALTIAPSRIETGTDLDDAAQLLLGERFTFFVPLDPLPFGQVVTDVTALQSALVVEAAGEDVVVVLP